MINLLPPSAKESLQKEEKYRLILIFGILVLLFLFSLSLILFAVKIYISGQVESQKILVNLEQIEFKSSQAQEIEKEIKSINTDLSKLDSFYKSRVNWTKLLERTSGTLPEGVYLTNLSLNPISPALIEARIAGYCPTREILFNFKKKLEQEPDFKQIYFPPTTWVKPKDIDFNLTFNLEL